MMLWRKDMKEMPNFKIQETYKFHAVSISKSSKFGHQLHNIQETSIEVLCIKELNDIHPSKIPLWSVGLYSSCKVSFESLIICLSIDATFVMRITTSIDDTNLFEIIFMLGFFFLCVDRKCSLIFAICIAIEFAGLCALCVWMESRIKIRFS